MLGLGCRDLLVFRCVGGLLPLSHECPVDRRQVQPLSLHSWGCLLFASLKSSFPIWSLSSLSPWEAKETVHPSCRAGLVTQG